jgi:hypothetical protein
MHRGFAPAAAIVIAVVLASVPATPTVAAAQTPVPITTVTAFAPVSSAPVPGVWYAADVRTGGSVGIVDLAGLGGDLEAGQPLPTGAARLTTDLTNTAKAEVAVANNFGILGGIIDTIRVGYSWHKATTVEGANLNAAPSLKLTFYNPVCDETPGADCYATLVYEPYMNGFGNFPTPDVWQRSDLDASTGGWWTTGGFGHPNGYGGCGNLPACPTLAQWLAGSTPDFAQATLVDVRVGVGTYNPGQTGYFDNVTIAGTAADASYDFNPPVRFTTVGECNSFLIAKNCSALKGRDRATCNHAQQTTCFDIFGVK